MTVTGGPSGAAAERHIPLAEPALNGNEARYLAECVRSNYVSSVGPFVERFETAFAERLASPHAVACSSGTAALHVALRLAGVERGDVVAVSDFTFIASANAVRYLGAEPLLVDSDAHTWNLHSERLHDHVEDLARRGQSLPAAIVAVHVLGQPADLEPLLSLRERFAIPIVEDAAEALGASVVPPNGHERAVGTVGDLGCFSFNGNKIITSGGGGMIVTPSDTLAARAKHLTTQAKVGGREYVHDTVGYNYRLTNVAAALGLAQLEQLETFLDAKAEIARRYDLAFSDQPIRRPGRLPGSRPSEWLYSLLLDPDRADRDRVLDRLARQRIGARPLWTPLHRQAPYASSPRVGTGETADDLHRRGLSLPCSVTLSPGDQDLVIRAVEQAIASA